MAIAKEDMKHISIVVAGHVDAGKSSLTGRLLYDMGGIDERMMEKLTKKAQEMGKPSFAFAYFMDNQKAEQERGITIACNTKEFYTSRYHYTIIDAPGHRDFIKNMITGSSQADVALLLCPADGGSFLSSIAKGDHKTGEVPGQTRNHARLLNLLGIKQLIVGINKMDCDVAKYGKERYTEVKDEIVDCLIKVGWKKKFVNMRVPILPISGWMGDNLLKKSDNMPWWKGQDVKLNKKTKIHIDTLYDALNNMVQLPNRNDEGLTRMPVSGVYKIKGVGDVITGRVEQGSISPGAEVNFLPTHTASNACSGKVFTVEMHHKGVAAAGPGDNVGMNVKGLDKLNMPQVGDVMVHKADDTLKACANFTAQVQILDHPGELKVGYTPIAYVRTGRAPVRLSKLNWKVGKSTGGQKVEDPLFLKRNEMAEVMFEPQQPFVVDAFKNCEGLGRIAIMEGNGVVMLGKVVAREFKVDDGKKK